MRQSGILMHITSLPGPDGIGSLGKEAYEFADFLHEAGMGIWQVLPMGPTGYGESPYQSPSTFAGNPMVISLDKLAEAGYLDLTGEERYVPENPEQVDYAAAQEYKMRLLRKAFAQSERKLKKQIAQFREENDWVYDFALFTAIKNHFKQQMWTKWPDEGARMRDPETLQKYEKKLGREIRFHLWCQYIFAQQWFALKAYVNGLGIKLFGDIPIYVAEDSADTWTKPEVFQLDEDRVPRRIAGVPPDYFSEDGQLWGNPLYRWSYLKQKGYRWWVERLTHLSKMYDIIRVDHFIGFANYYSVAHGAPNAKKGRWIIGPDKDLFITLKKKLPDLDIVAEDLGVVNDRVRNLIAFTGYPGMKVLSFAFGADDSNVHLPDNIPENTAYYTGTHDNVTALARVKNATPVELECAKKIVGFKTVKQAPWAFIQTVFASKARIAMAPMQDVLGLDDWATMNRPGTTGGNWLWRMKPDAATPAIARKLKKLNKDCKRNL
ncbi:MAG: 4-alpha-glucanotransferase [Clostridia bacterium]|nr:4-alpha-glucanotransferase [Clostridia bacterium]